MTFFMSFGRDRIQLTHERTTFLAVSRTLITQNVCRKKETVPSL